MAKMSAKLICTVFAAALAVAGCGSQKKDDVESLTKAPDLALIGPVPEYVGSAIDAVGGLDAWAKITELKLDCIATFYQSDGSFYLTEQSYTVYPWSNAIRVSGAEPTGQFLWQLHKGQLTVVQGTGDIEALTVSLPARCLAEALLTITTVPARFTDKSVEFSGPGEALKIRGQWYYPIKRLKRPNVRPALDLPPSVFYANRDSSLVDVISLGYPSVQKLLSVRAYDYHKLDNKGILLPSRIEVLETDGSGLTEKPLVRMDVRQSGAP